MKVFICADMEGITGCNCWSDVEKGKDGYEQIAEQMTKEVLAAVNGAKKAGADEIFVKDAHWTGRNLILSMFPEGVNVARGWGETPFTLVEGIDQSFDAAIFIGFHSGAMQDTNPISHTISTSYRYIKINGKYISEFDLGLMSCAYFNVPVVFISGDKGLCEYVKTNYQEISTFATIKGVGTETVMLHSLAGSCEKIKNNVYEKFKSNIFKVYPLPNEFHIEISYKNHANAYRLAFYPGSEKIDEFTVSYKTNDFYEALRFKYFSSNRFVE